MDNRTEPVADGVWRVEVGFYVNSFVVANDGRGDAEGLTLVDTGWRRSGPRLVRSIRHLGLDPRAIGDVLLTHWHNDHAGSAARFVRSSARPTVHVGTGDRDIVAGAAKPPAGPPATTRLGGVLTGVGVYRQAEAVPEAVPLADGQRFAAGGGLEVVAAPGHTPGHCAFWLPERGVLIAGDAVWNVWFLSRGPRFACSALPARRSTLHRLSELAPGVLAMAHGPPVTRDAAAKLSALAS
jgi:glyoxylase-like metal-dependent hydrolase (beta-lactamase superfamily II)